MLKPGARRRGGTAALLVIAALTAASCRQVSREEAAGLVERYNKVVSEAYRRGDVNLVDPVVGEHEGKKLTGLIGVRLDLGITLDSELLSLEVTRVDQAREALRVHTRESWRYLDRKIGTGEQVGDESLDLYEMVYVFTRKGGEWLVGEVQFATPPVVGRRTAPWTADPRIFHGMVTKPTSTASKGDNP